jgi:hypothetical protein
MTIRAHTNKKNMDNEFIFENTFKEHMSMFFERQLVGMAITSPQKGWLHINTKLCNMFGYSKQKIAEGVEDKDVLDVVDSFGCDEVQGYHFAKPMNSAQFEKFQSEFMSQKTNTNIT